ncbi:hypothetical protein GPX89_24980 [Nocardia sp. ET3-3]|uniref:Ig-like domain-containing protein n=1 Tax=Nocardia terrae TaxID=2675851 RepID=A0A7K1V1H3_9NOCA|nr:hypothetical protein [Nocardia terrae]MVU80490.1 hypothetical protein [Nocardia terrae]
MRSSYLPLIGLVAAASLFGSPAALAATVSAGGAVSSTGNWVMIPVTYTCSPSDGSPSLTATAQNVTNGSSGFGTSPATCDDTLQVAYLSVVGTDDHSGDIVSYTIIGPGGAAASGTLTIS